MDLATRERGIGGVGWRGDKSWRDSVNRVRQGDNVDTPVIPTPGEARTLIEEAGGVEERHDNPHQPPNPHSYPHINYTTPTGKKGTIRVTEGPPEVVEQDPNGDEP